MLLPTDRCIISRDGRYFEWRPGQAAAMWSPTELKAYETDLCDPAGIAVFVSVVTCGPTGEMFTDGLGVVRYVSTLEPVVE